MAVSLSGMRRLADISRKSATVALIPSRGVVVITTFLSSKTSFAGITSQVEVVIVYSKKLRDRR